MLTEKMKEIGEELALNSKKNRRKAGVLSKFDSGKQVN